MPGFLGHYEFQIDEKGRVSLPSAFRKAASGDTFVLLQWQPTHLDLFPEESWAGVQSKLLEFRRAQPDGAAYFRRIMSNAVEVELDKQGRIRVPDRLREAVGLDSAVVLIGAVDRIELWSPRGFEEQVESGGSEFAQFAPQIFG